MTSKELHELGEKLVHAGAADTPVLLTGTEAKRLIALLELIFITTPLEPGTLSDRWLRGILNIRS